MRYLHYNAVNANLTLKAVQTVIHDLKTYEAAVFVPIQKTYSALWTANKQAVLAGHAAHAFLIAKESYLYSDAILDEILNNPDSVKQEFECMNGSSAQNHVLHCLALSSTESRKTVLMYHEKQQYWCACFPPITVKHIELEKHWSTITRELSQAINTSRYEYGLYLPNGYWNISDLLREISKAIGNDC